jgi:hypothetical protein
MEDQSKASWIEENYQHWGDLGKFYTQIESFTNLEVLELNSLGPHTYFGQTPPSSRSPLDRCLPWIVGVNGSC